MIGDDPWNRRWNGRDYRDIVMDDPALWRFLCSVWEHEERERAAARAAREGNMWIQLAILAIQYLGPILLEWFKTWLEKRLREKAAQFEKQDSHETKVRFGSDPLGGQIRLVKAVRDDLWFWQVAKRRACDQCIAHLESGAIGPNTPKVG